MASTQDTRPFDLQFFGGEPEEVAEETAEEAAVEEPEEIAEEDTDSDELPEEAESDEEDGGDGSFMIGEHDMTGYATEYAEEGALSDGSYAELAEMGFSRELVDTYIAGREAAERTTRDLAASEESEILAIAGGSESYRKMIEWAKDAFSAEEAAAYDEIMETGDRNKIGIAVRGLVARYADKFGSSPKLVKKGGGGRGVTAHVKGFESQAEMIKAMSDRRYGEDDDYTRKVDERTAYSPALGYKGN